MEKGVILLLCSHQNCKTTYLASALFLRVSLEAPYKSHQRVLANGIHNHIQHI